MKISKMFLVNLIVFFVLMPAVSGCGPAFLDAAKKGDLITVRKKIAANSEDVDLNRALFYAARDSHYQMAELLLGEGADANFTGWEWTPLYLAALNGRIDMAQLLLDSKADVNGRSLSKARTIKDRKVEQKEGKYFYHFEEKERGLTPIFAAIAKGRSQMADLLLERGADPNVRGIWNEAHHNVGGGYPASGFGLKTAIAIEGEAAPRTLEIGSDGSVVSSVEPTLETRLSALQLARSLKHEEIIKRLIEQGAVE